MNITLRDIVTHKKAISTLLLLALLSMVLLPAHYHLHHADELLEADAVDHAFVGDMHHDAGFEAAAKHHNGDTTDHVVDMHFDTGTESIADHPVGHVIDSPSNIVLKLSKLQLLLLALLLVFSFFLPLRTRKERPRWAIFEQEFPCFYPYSTPLLRAPPHS